MRVILVEFKRRSVFGQAVHIHGKEVNLKFAVNVMQFIPVAFFDGQVFGKPFQVGLIINAASAIACMNDKMFSLPLRLQHLAAVRASENKRVRCIYTA
jgi:hypothetical protein